MTLKENVKTLTTTRQHELNFYRQPIEIKFEVDDIVNFVIDESFQNSGFSEKKKHFTNDNFYRIVRVNGESTSYALKSVSENQEHTIYAVHHSDLTRIDLKSLKRMLINESEKI